MAVKSEKAPVQNVSAGFQASTWNGLNVTFVDAYVVKVENPLGGTIILTREQVADLALLVSKSKVVV
jgi:hypothetical protein